MRTNYTDNKGKYNIYLVTTIAQEMYRGERCGK